MVCLVSALTAIRKEGRGTSACTSYWAGSARSLWWKVRFSCGLGSADYVIWTLRREWVQSARTPSGRWVLKPSRAKSLKGEFWRLHVDECEPKTSNICDAPESTTTWTVSLLQHLVSFNLFNLSTLFGTEPFKHTLEISQRNVVCEHELFFKCFASLSIKKKDPKDIFLFSYLSHLISNVKPWYAYKSFWEPLLEARAYSGVLVWDLL